MKIFFPKNKMKFLFPVEAMGGMPKFIGQLQNVTVSEGRDATFTCSVTNLGGHKVIPKPSLKIMTARAIF